MFEYGKHDGKCPERDTGMPLKFKYIFIIMSPAQ